MLVILIAMTLIGVVVVIAQQSLNHREVMKHMANQEQELQAALAVLDTVSTGVTEIISRLNNVPTENPAINDEITSVKAVAQRMADAINAVLNPPAPTP